MPSWRSIAAVAGLAATTLLAAASPARAQEPGAGGERRGFLGVQLGAHALPGTDPARAVIEVGGVVPGSAAERAGIEAGDVILALDGEAVDADPGQVVARFAERIRARQAGQTVVLRVRRRSVSIQSFLEGQPLGPEAEAPAPRRGAILPDLAALLDEHPERLLEVRARASTLERDVPVELGARPDEADGGPLPPLPANDTLRPDLQALDLAPAAAVASRVLAAARAAGLPAGAAHDDLLARFDEDERKDDPFRLRAVRFLRRDPLRLPTATRRLADELRTALGAGDAAGVVATCRAQLDLAPLAQTLPLAPPAGASVAAHADYVSELVRVARARVEAALAALTADERELLGRELPSLAARFAEDLYLHEDPDPARWQRHRGALEVLPRVDRGQLLAALAALVPLSDPAYLDRLEADLRAAEAAGVEYPGGAPATRGRVLFNQDRDVGLVLVGGSGPNEYRCDPAVLIDLGGDDSYHQAAGGARPDRPAAVLIDLAGDDRYQATAPFAQGGALLGAALLVDRGGDDVYTSSVGMAQGAALCGAALLVDLAGDDFYRGPEYVQGSALCQGLGLLLDLGGDDRVEAGLYAQGFGGPGALGGLLARGGHDRYAATGQVPCTYGDAGIFHAMSQGVGCGFRHQASGGIGVLLDDGGDDVYEGGNFAQGGGYYYAWGLLADLGPGADRYEGSRYAQAWAAHSALGSLVEEGGDDTYRGWVGAQLSAAWDLCATSFVDEAGRDRYEPGNAFSVGASAHNGLALFADLEGADHYGSEPGPTGPNDYHGGSSLSLFLDAGPGDDRYPGAAPGRPDLTTHSLRIGVEGPLRADDPDLLELLGAAAAGVGGGR